MQGGKEEGFRNHALYLRCKVDFQKTEDSFSNHGSVGGKRQVFRNQAPYRREKEESVSATSPHMRGEIEGGLPRTTCMDGKTEMVSETTPYDREKGCFCKSVPYGWQKEKESAILSCVPERVWGSRAPELLHHRSHDKGIL